MCVVAALTASAAMASAAGAAPKWKSNGSELTSPETIVAETPASTLTFSTLSTTCKATITGKIANTTGFGGVINVESMTLSACGTNAPVCTVTAAKAANLPWGGAGLTIEGNPYEKITGFENDITYGGELCAISELTVPFKGTIGGLFNNSNSTLNFNAATAEATNSTIKSIGSTPTTYTSEWSVKETGANAGQTLTLS
jgi:hypothetical protein